LWCCCVTPFESKLVVDEYVDNADAVASVCFGEISGYNWLECILFLALLTFAVAVVVLCPVLQR
jgi:hypothetical protein